MKKTVGLLLMGFGLGIIFSTLFLVYVVMDVVILLITGIVVASCSVPLLPSLSRYRVKYKDIKKKPKLFFEEINLDSLFIHANAPLPAVLFKKTSTKKAISLMTGEELEIPPDMSVKIPVELDENIAFDRGIAKLHL